MNPFSAVRSDWILTLFLGNEKLKSNVDLIQTLMCHAYFEAEQFVNSHVKKEILALIRSIYQYFVLPQHFISPLLQFSEKINLCKRVHLLFFFEQIVSLHYQKSMLEKQFVHPDKARITTQALLKFVDEKRVELLIYVHEHIEETNAGI
jgi:hypothetical protein